MQVARIQVTALSTMDYAEDFEEKSNGAWLSVPPKLQSADLSCKFLNAPATLIHDVGAKARESSW